MILGLNPHSFSNLPAGEQKKLLECLAAGGRSIGQLEEALGLPAGKLMAQMTLLELDGLVESLPGKRFKLSG